MELARDLVAFLTAFGLTGWLLGFVVVPGRLAGEARLFLSLALAVPATALVAAPGLLLDELSAWTVIASLALVAAIAAARVGEPLARLRAGLDAGVARWRTTSLAGRGAIGLALVATWLAVLAPQGIEDVGDPEPNGTIVYYHWGVVQHITEAGGIPETLNEWGRPRPFPYEYLVAGVHGGATSALAGSSDFAMSERYRLALGVVALVAALALWRRWLPTWWAWAAAVLTLAVSRIDTRLLVYKPEAVAFVLVLWSAWLFDCALERRSPRWAALAGVVLAAAFLAHPVGSLLAAPLWLGIAVGRLAWARRPRPMLRSLGVAAAVFAVIVVGARGLIGSADQDLQQSPTEVRDPTRVIYALAYISDRPRAASELRLPECSDMFGIESTTRPFLASNASWLAFDLSRPGPVVLLSGAIFLAAGFALLAEGSGWGLSATARRGILTWATYACGVFLLAHLICAVYDTWVPERVGPLRVMPYWAVALPGAFTALGWAVSRLAERRWRNVRLAGPVAAGVAAALLLWGLTPALGGRDRAEPAFEAASSVTGGLSPEAEAAYEWIDSHLPSDAVIMANGYTEGALGSLSGRTGWLDGRTPFVQPEPWRSQARRALAQARRYFKQPRRDLIPSEVTHILVGGPGTNLGGSLFPTDVDRLARASNLRAVQGFGQVTLFAVRGP